MESAPKTISSLVVASLVVELPTGVVRHPLVGRENTVGRDLSNAICIADRYVSAFHARLVNIGDGFNIEDLGSENKTLVNGRAVTTARLKYGDEIHFGAVSCRLLAPQEMDLPSPRPKLPPRTTDHGAPTAKLGERKPFLRASPTFGVPVEGHGGERLQRYLIAAGLVACGGILGLTLRMC